MTEAQKAQSAEPADARAHGAATPPTESRHFELKGRSWTIVDLPDGRSWSLYGKEESARGPAPRLAHITISEGGYFSTDRAGVVRGPYTTLDEAVDPIALDDRLLLDDPDSSTHVAPPTPAKGVVAGPDRARGRWVVLGAVAALGLLIVASRVRAGRARPVARRPTRPAPPRS